ncbi:Hypothetical predicted protein, partial [Pelobates cultripes]
HILTKLKMKTYTQGNKAGKHLANLLRQKQANYKMPHLITNTGGKLHNPQDINDGMADYYHSHYNLKTDPTLHQPTPQEIDDFLQTTTLPILTTAPKDIIQNPITT